MALLTPGAVQADRAPSRDRCDLGIAAIAAFYLVHTYWYTPQVMEIEVLQLHLQQLESQNLQAQVVAARGGAGLEERLAVYERHVDRLEQLIPESEEVPALMNSITMEAQRAGVDLTGLNPEASDPSELYTLQSYEVDRRRGLSPGGPIPDGCGISPPDHHPGGPRAGGFRWGPRAK